MLRGTIVNHMLACHLGMQKAPNAKFLSFPHLVATHLPDRMPQNCLCESILLQKIILGDDKWAGFAILTDLSKDRR